MSDTFLDAHKTHLTGMYQDWFLDYASYVILERAVPAIEDGLKPVQRRILYAMDCVDDGKMNKVANLVGQTMQYHPHGDASIGDALVQLGQKGLLIDCQGNWGNILTGDGAAAPRYIEARLSPFALEVLFNPKTTHWMLSYDGRKKEPIHLPVKFPLLLAQGVEGIAVGLNSKILPHNFNELCEAALHYLNDEPFTLYPDFPTGGEIDVSRYNDGQRGGIVRIRAKITKSSDGRDLIISEVPFGTTTAKLIETILAANQKGSIKVRKVDDYTAAEAKIVVHLQPGYSSDKAIDALYAFTDCEVKISPNCCVVEDKKPIFTTVSDLLRQSVNTTKDLLGWELQIQQSELEEKYFFSSLERIFIENRIYKTEGYEQSPNKEKLVSFMHEALAPFADKLLRPITDEDIEKLFDIKMLRITKFDAKKADELLKDLKKQIKDTEYHLSHLVEYTISWFEGLQKKYGGSYARKTVVRSFTAINAKTVIENTSKLYVDYKEGFIGTGLKKGELLCACSTIDDVLVIHKDGTYKIVKVCDKCFVGEDPLHVAIYRKTDTRTIYNVIYRDGKDGNYYMKRCALTGLMRDKEYDLTQGTPGSKILYFTSNANGEAEVVRVLLRPAPRLKNTKLLVDFSHLDIKGRGARGNLVTKNPIRSIALDQQGHSTLGGRKVWYDADVLRLNYDGIGKYLGEFMEGDMILTITKKGDYCLLPFELTSHFTPEMMIIEKFIPDKVWSLAQWNAELGFYYGKRFTIDGTTKVQNMLGDDARSYISVLSDKPKATFALHYADEKRGIEEVLMSEFIDVKSPHSKGKRLTTYPLDKITDVTPVDVAPQVEAETSTTEGDVVEAVDDDPKLF